MTRLSLFDPAFSDNFESGYFGTISRTFSLADDVDDEKADATYADGVLTLVLPKKATAASRKVAVH